LFGDNIIAQKRLFEKKKEVRGWDECNITYLEWEELKRKIDVFFEREKRKTVLDMDKIEIVEVNEKEYYCR